MTGGPAMGLDGLVAAISRSRIIAASPRAVWDVLADFGALSSWAGNVDHSCLLEHGEDGGAIGASRRIQLGRNTLVERITDFEPPTTLGYDVEGLPRRVRCLRSRWTLRPIAPGFTEVTLASTVEIGSNPAQRLAERIFGRVTVKQLDLLLAGLAKKVEGSDD